MADIRFLLAQGKISSAALQAAFSQARVPDVPELRALFSKAQAQVLAAVEQH